MSRDQHLGPGRTISYQSLLDHIATCEPEEGFAGIEAAVVVNLLHPVVWRSRPELTSIAGSRHRPLMQRVAREIGRDIPVHIGATDGARRSNQNQWDVLVSTAHLPKIQAWRREQWHRTAAHIVRGDARVDQRAAARTLWRSALLVASSGQRRRQLRVCVPDAADLNLFRASGAVLGLPTATRSRQGHLHVITVDDGAAHKLLQEVGADWMADAWVKPS